MGIKLFNKTYASKLGAALIIISASITLIAVPLTSINTSFDFMVICDISWILTMVYGLMKFKR